MPIIREIGFRKMPEEKNLEAFLEEHRFERGKTQNSGGIEIVTYKRDCNLNLYVHYEKDMLPDFTWRLTHPKEKIVAQATLTAYPIFLEIFIIKEIKHFADTIAKRYDGLVRQV